jgi:AmmeMemoRadiSam system protein B
MSSVRKPAVAGLFYPADPEALRSLVQASLSECPAVGAPPKAIIAPHAGYAYSGPVAAAAYAPLQAARGIITRVVLLGPAHRVSLAGLAAPSAFAFETPLGLVEIDPDGLRHALSLPQVHLDDSAHVPEHSLEVHLPFLQVVLERFRIVPLLVGESTPDLVAEVVEALWGGAETLIVVSSDLSHYHTDADARQIDAETARRIECLEVERLSGRRACGHLPVSGLLQTARRDGLRVRTLALRNSGDASGDRSRVVGYGAFAVG